MSLNRSAGTQIADVQPPELVRLNQHDDAQISSPDVPEILTVSEVAARLRCSKAHVCNTINGKVRGVTPLPAISMGRRKLVRREALATWLARNEPGGML
jgi:excisionase family DNA binding protein